MFTSTLHEQALSGAAFLEEMPRMGFVSSEIAEVNMLMAIIS
jgi:hypothetical protein